jgi:hypothetical protein
MPREIRVGRWVQTPDGVGIVTAISPDGIGVDHVNDDGQTIILHDDQGRIVRRAYAMSALQPVDQTDIPAVRRNPKAATLSDPISDEENERKNAAIARGEFKE